MLAYYIGINGICGLNPRGNGLLEAVIDRYGDVALSHAGLSHSIATPAHSERAKSGQETKVRICICHFPEQIQSFTPHSDEFGRRRQGKRV